MCMESRHSFKGVGLKTLQKKSLRNISETYRGADKSLARQGRKQGTATEYFVFHVSYL
jgi:hypothetical protein